MASSMNSREINDVLSSIRRLVSGEVPDMKHANPHENDRFVLTPAHRVMDDVPDHGPAKPITDVRAENDPVPVPLELVDPTFELPRKHDWDTQPANEQPTAPDPYAWMRTIPGEGAANPVDSPPETTPETTEQSPPSAPVHTLEDRIAELEEAVGRSEDEWEPDGSEPDSVQLPKRHLFEVVDNGSVQEAEPADQPDFVEQLPFSSTREPDPRNAPLQLSEVATFTHVPAKTLRPTPPSKPAPPKNIPSISHPEVVNNDEDVFVDEDILRRVVTEIVREELQGKMGERITRNVRRMVRREIEQTLSLKDFQ